MDDIGKIENGYRLSIHLQPNHDNLATNDPEYLETYNLPLVFAEDDIFAGVTRPGHFHREQNGNFDALSFSYNNGMPFYSIIFSRRVKPETADVAVKLMSQTHYRTHEFCFKDPGRCVYEVESRNGTYERRDLGLTESIRTGGDHYLVIRLDDTRIWSLPIDISYAYFQSGHAEFRTECYVTSSHCTQPKSFERVMLEKQPDALSLMAMPSFSPDLFLAMQLTYLHVTDDGTFQDSRSDAAEATGNYQWIKVFEYP